MVTRYIYLLKIDTDNIKYLSIKKIRQVVNRKVVNVHRYLKIHTEVTQLRTYATFNGSRVGIIENLWIKKLTLIENSRIKHDYHNVISILVNCCQHLDRFAFYVHFQHSWAGSDELRKMPYSIEHRLLVEFVSAGVDNDGGVNKVFLPVWASVAIQSQVPFKPCR